MLFLSFWPGQGNHQFDTDWQAGFIDGKMGIVQGINRVAGLGRTEPEETAIEFLEITGKVFGCHGRFVDSCQNVRAKAVFGYAGDESRLLRRIADSRIARS